ncbi:MAG: hypothetical protein U0163_03380 [Gemmatimonadaceae bacterium]
MWLLAAASTIRVGAQVPPAAPAVVAARGSSVSLRYAGHVILDGTLDGDRAVRRVLVDSSGGRVTQIISWSVRQGRVTLRAIVHGTRDAIAVDADPREDGVPIVRHSSGPSYNGLNRAVYARSGDWLLSVDFPAAVHVTPVAGGDSSAFELEASGFEVTLRFRPRYYQQHRGLTRYAPWTYQPWRRSMAGWTSWFAFKDKVTEADVRRSWTSWRSGSRRSGTR